MEKIPFHGEWKRARAKKFEEAILLVPFFGGHKKSLQRHVEFLNDEGFDCLIFNLKTLEGLKTELVDSRGQFGLKEVWTDQIEAMLNLMPGPKIIFSFSNPSASAIEAIGRRNAAQIKGLICDSGPSGNFWRSLVNYYTHERPLRTYPLRAFAAAVTSFLWHPQFSSVLQKDLQKLPKGFRVLSIRGWKDPLVTPQMIDQVFEPHTQIDWQKLSLPQAGHLNGLKDFHEDYVSGVRKFLKELTSR